jgi:hypothetical protein
VDLRRGRSGISLPVTHKPETSLSVNGDRNLALFWISQASPWEREKGKYAALDIKQVIQKLLFHGSMVVKKAAMWSRRRCAAL